MKVLCSGHDVTTKHEMKSAEMAHVLEVIQEGDGQKVTPRGVETLCLLMLTPAPSTKEK